MRKYKRHDWPALIKAFHNSGQNQVQFCKSREINARYFNQQLGKFLTRDKAQFVSVDVEPPSIDPIDAGLTITVGRCKIQCPTSMLLQSFTALVQSLA